MILFFVFMFCNLLSIGIAYAVYGKKRVWKEGMLLGVHIPRQAVETDEIVSLLSDYERLTKKFYFWNVIFSVLVCGLAFSYMTVFIAAWCVWCIECFGGAIFILYRAHRKLYDLKVKKGWIGCGGSRVLAAVDTKMTTQSGKMGITESWHLLLIFFILLPCIIPDVRNDFLHSDEGCIIFGCTLAMGFCFFILHRIILKIKNKVYSENSDINIRLNRIQKNTWSWILMGSGIVNVLSYLVAVQFMPVQDGKESVWYIIYIISLSIPVLFIIAGYCYIAKEKEKVLSCDNEPVYIDDDVYWKNGWYSNPHDTRLLVQDWTCSWNYSMNMAKPAGKICLAAALFITAACFIAVIVLVARVEFTPVELRSDETGIHITSGYSDYTVSYTEIAGIQIVNQLPDDNFRRINGGDDSRMMVGKFRGTETGNCRIYLYKGYEPVLEMITDNGPVYINSKNDGEVVMWYNEISALTERNDR